MLRRAAALWLLLFAVYAGTLGMDAFDGSDYGGDEPHYVLTAKSLLDDGDPDLRDEYAERAYAQFYPGALDPHGSLTDGRVNEPHGIGFPLLIAPAFALGGPKGAELFLAVLAALAIALGYALALRVVPDPWAVSGALAIGLSPPLVAYSTAVYPELAAGAAICGAALLALRLSERATRAAGWGCFALLALLPWLGPKYLPAGAVVGVFAYRALRAARRPVLALSSAEITGFSIALYVGFSEGLYGGITQYAANLTGETATGASSAIDYLERTYRLAALFVDRDYGLLRWAPVLALALFGAWLIWRERRSGLALAIPGRRDELSAATLCAAVVAAQLVAAAFLAPEIFGFWFAGRHLVAVLPVAITLVALGLRRAPRIGAAAAALGVVASAWLVADVRLGGGTLVDDLPDAPWGPLVRAFPLFERGSAYPFVLAAAIGVALLATLVAGDRRAALRRAA